MVDRQLIFSVHLAAAVMERYFTRTSQRTQPAETQAQDEGESSHFLI
jgi:hypothetical protein